MHSKISLPYFCFVLSRTAFPIFASLGLLVHAQTVSYSTDFESSESYSLGSLHSQNGWQVTQGAASVTNGNVFSGAYSVSLAASTPPAIVTRSFAQFTGKPIVFVDFFARPTAGTSLAGSTLFDAESSRAGFLQVGAAGEVYAYDGNGSGGGTWVATGRTLSIDSNSQSTDWVRFTFRQDYTLKKWDLYVDGLLAGYHYGFKDNTRTVFAAFTLQAAT
ncbi:MAG: beta-glucosidase, partial [Verrucomicrobia bacterium]|nr:beta-glucosidase [Verrucomicrobiota bacterium]